MNNEDLARLIASFILALFIIANLVTKFTIPAECWFSQDPAFCKTLLEK